MNTSCRFIVYKLSFILILIFQANSAFALDPVYSDFWGKAIKGYDPVAYFKAGQATPGKIEFSYEWNGATWRFASQQNRTEFMNAPENFAPQYGGYCAWAVSQGYTAKIDPHAWHIHQGKLYLNFNKAVQKTWQQDVPGHIVKGNQNWPKLLSKNE